MLVRSLRPNLFCLVRSRRFNSNLPINRKEDENSLNEKFNPDVSKKVSVQNGSLPSINSDLTKLLTKQKDYNPNKLEKSKNYEFNPPKSINAQMKEKLQARVQPKSKFKKMLPSIIVSAGLCWAIFMYKYFNNDKDPNVDSNSSLLSPEEYLSYIISFNHQITEDTYLIELTRKNRLEKLMNNEQLFDGSKIWSIEIAKPDINITRFYTPLPLYVAGINPNNQVPHLKLVETLEQEGKFVIIVKKYEQGEFSKWITQLPLLSEIKIRGPVIDHKFPFHPLDKFNERPQVSNLIKNIKPDEVYPANLPKPENYIFFGAGTGILPVLQVLYSPNPPKGFIDVWYSLRDEKDLLNQFKTLNLFLEECGRAKFHYLFNRKPEMSEIPSPTIPNFSSYLDLKVSNDVYKDRLLREKKQQIKDQLAGKSTTSDTISEAKGDIEKPAFTESTNNVDVIPEVETRIKPENAYQQWKFFKKDKAINPPSFAFVCGPPNYITELSGKPDLNNLEMKDTGAIGGLLKDEGWSLQNIKRFN